MLTGTQIGQDRTLLGWPPGELSRKPFLKQDIIDQAEKGDGTALLIYGHEIATRRSCEQAGVEFADHPPSARAC